MVKIWVVSSRSWDGCFCLLEVGQFQNVGRLLLGVRSRNLDALRDVFLDEALRGITAAFYIND